MAAHHLRATELVELLATGRAHDELTSEHGGAVVVQVGIATAAPDAHQVVALRSLPAVLLLDPGGGGRPDPSWVACADAVLPATGQVRDGMLETCAGNPLAATALALLLRDSEARALTAGLVAESTTYSMLQAGPEFARWRASRPVRSRPPDGAETVVLERSGDTLTITLSRPEVRNALSARMRDELVEAFALPQLDPTIAVVHLRGAGPAFCSGGDLDEFGSRHDPVAAHLVRLARSPARAIAAVADRVVAHLHGPCIGSGIELAAFATTISAAADTTIALPEVGLGLVPGAGGTVSLPRRIGRHRTAALALSGETIDVGTARRWGLVDHVEG